MSRNMIRMSAERDFRGNKVRVLRTFMHNTLRNYQYLIGCQRTGKAIALDPLDGEAVVALAREHDLTITHIVNTHEHSDHIAGNDAVYAATRATVCAPKLSGGKIAHVSQFIDHGDRIVVGDIELEAIYTAGHMLSHTMYRLHGEDAPILFAGDLLMNACSGNCFNGGSLDDLYAAFVARIQPLSGDTLIYPGHDYMKTNLSFVLSLCPQYKAAGEWLDKVKNLEPDEMPVMNLAQERTYNPFLRLHDTELRAQLMEKHPNMGVGDVDVFKALRAMRDQW